MNENLLEKEKKIKAVLIDDNESATVYIKEFIGDDPNFIIIRCHSVEEALRAIEEYKPDILFIDNNLSPIGNEGIEIIRRIKESGSDMEIVSITDNEGIAKMLEEQYKIKWIDKDDYSKMKEIIAEAQVKKDTKEK